MQTKSFDDEVPDSIFQKCLKNSFSTEIIQKIAAEILPSLISCPSDGTNNQGVFNRAANRSESKDSAAIYHLFSAQLSGNYIAIMDKKREQTACESSEDSLH